MLWDEPKIFFLERRYFFSIILSEFLKNRVALHRLTDAVIRRMEYEERIRPLIEANLREMGEIEAAIGRIQDPMEREVLRLRYLDGACWRPMPWGEVALRIYGDNDDKHLRATYRLYSRALSSMGVYDKEGDSDE